MSKFTFRESSKVKNEIVIEQAKQIQKMYEDSLKEVKDKINLLTSKQSTSNKAIQLKQLEAEINKAYSVISSRIETAIKNNSNIVLDAVLNDAKNLAGKIGFTASAAYAKVPEKVIEKLVTGQIYQEGWTLSKALWKDENLMRQDIQNIVAKGIAGNKSTFEIAKTLEKYVDPNAAKPWDWGKVYPGSKQKIDYNAQRLARTMVNHAYQQGTVEVIKENPFIEKVRWLSALAVGRTCELCESRNNVLFDKDKVPLDHPNGLCTIAPEVEDLDDIAKKAKAWKDAPDGTYPEIDTYAKSLGYKSKVEPAVKTKAKPVLSKTKAGLKKESLKAGMENKSSVIVEELKKSKFPDKFIKDINELIDNLPDDDKNWILSNQSDFKGFKKATSERQFFSPDTKQITIKTDLHNDVNGSYSAFFHEYGHFLDSAKGKISSNEAFLNKLKSDVKKLTNKPLYNIVDRLPQKTFNELFDNDKTGGIQDIIDGMTGGKVHVKWGHSAEYWNRKEESLRWTEVTSEAFAEMNETLIDEEKKVLFKKYLPDAYEEFLSIIKNQVKI